MTRMYKILTFQASALAAGVLMMSVAVDMARAAPPPAAAVQIGNFTFNSQMLTVKSGTTVTWTNADDIPHTVVSKDGVFKSKVLDTGDHFSFTFTKPGQFGYFCSLHPHMTASVIVKA
jgi:plastocyanin